MNKFLLGSLAILFVWLIGNHVAKPQERIPWQVGIFGGGSQALGFNSAKRPRHSGLALGPTYQLKTGKFAIELFAKGGVSTVSGLSTGQFTILVNKFTD